MRAKHAFVWAICAAAVAISGTTQSHAGASGQPPSAGAQSGDTKTDESLSKKLNRNDGVLKPQQGVDPGIHQPAPGHTGDDMPVIIPPGEPGGDQSVQPK